MNRTAQSPAEADFQYQAFQNTVNLIDQVDDRQLYLPTVPEVTAVDSKRRPISRFSRAHPNKRARLP
jgi:hypothetical protein